MQSSPRVRLPVLKRSLALSSERKDQWNEVRNSKQLKRQQQIQGILEDIRTRRASSIAQNRLRRKRKIEQTSQKHLESFQRKLMSSIQRIENQNKEKTIAQDNYLQTAINSQFIQSSLRLQRQQERNLKLRYQRTKPQIASPEKAQFLQEKFRLGRVSQQLQERKRLLKRLMQLNANSS